MPRKPRMYLPGVPAHVVQRGNNRAACFFADADRLYYLQCIEKALRRYQVQLHAYVLMSNHVHLLMTPGDEHGISHVMQDVGRKYVYYVNKAYRRSGTLWEGRHKASLIDADAYLLACYRYIELNPVTAGMVAVPEDYRWSSYHWHGWGRNRGLLTEHPLYEGLGASTEARCRVYRDFVGTRVDEAIISRVRHSLARNYPLGSDRFRVRIETALGRSVGEDKQGRPYRKPVQK